MSLIKINHNPSQRELFYFGAILPLFVALLGTILKWGWKLPTVANWVWIVGAALTAVFVAIPPLRRPIYLGWIYAALPIGWTISHFVLGVVFYLVLTPIGLLMRLFGRDPLHLKLDRQAKSYWIARPEPSDASRYFRQF
jgi:hypothetical protein